MKNKPPFLGRFYRLGFALFLALSLFAPSAKAQAPAFSYIRDAEVEETVRQMADPLLYAAGLEPSAVKIFILNNKNLNAFVAGGQNIFIHTGLLIRSENAEQVMGVLAHEIGHIAGGHIARRDAEIQDARSQAWITAILAGAASVALGRAEAASAVMTAGSLTVQNSLLAFSRTQERSADQAGISFLASIGQSPRGLLEFFTVLQKETRFLVSQTNPYLQTHPLTQERITNMQEALEHSRYQTAAPSAELEMRHARLRAKLMGFLDNPDRTLGFYAADDKSFAARYGRAIAQYKQGKLDEALAAIHQLEKENPKDGYLYELEGQMLFENSRIDKAIAVYRKALSLQPQQPLIRLSLGQALLESNDKAFLEEAIALIEDAARYEPLYPVVWRLAAIAYGRKGDMGNAALALAEQALTERRTADAQLQAQRALQLLPANSPAARRAQDIKAQTAPKT